MYRFLLKYSIMNAQLQRMYQTAKIVHIAVCEGFFLFLYIWVLFQAIMWMLSLATCHFSSTFIKQLEWQYLDAVHRKAYNVKQLFFYWNHYWVSIWDMSGHWSEDHQWIMTKWIFKEVIWVSSCIVAQELPIGKPKENLKCQLRMLSYWFWHEI